MCELPFQIICVCGVPCKKRNLAHYLNVGLTTDSLRRDSDLGLAVVSVDGGGCFWLPNGSLQSHWFDGVGRRVEGNPWQAAVYCWLLDSLLSLREIKK